MSGYSRGGGGGNRGGDYGYESAGGGGGYGGGRNDFNRSYGGSGAVRGSGGISQQYRDDEWASSAPGGGGRGGGAAHQYRGESDWEMPQRGGGAAPAGGGRRDDEWSAAPRGGGGAPVGGGGGEWGPPRGAPTGGEKQYRDGGDYHRGGYEQGGKEDFGRSEPGRREAVESVYERGGGTAYKHEIPMGQRGAAASIDAHDVASVGSVQSQYSGGNSRGGGAGGGIGAAGSRGGGRDIYERAPSAISHSSTLEKKPIIEVGSGEFKSTPVTVHPESVKQIPPVEIKKPAQEPVDAGIGTAGQPITTAASSQLVTSAPSSSDRQIILSGENLQRIIELHRTMAEAHERIARAQLDAASIFQQSMKDHDRA